MNLFICLQLVGIFVINCNGLIQENIKPLTENFFANLQANLGDTDFNPEAVQFIDDQINNYINLIQETHHGYENNQSKKIKRDATDGKNNYGTYLFNGLVHQYTIPVKHPKDIKLFKHDVNDTTQWYAAAIEHGDSDDDYLVVLKYNNNTFIELNRKLVKNGIKLGVHTRKNTSYIVVAENTESKVDFKYKTGIFEFNASEELYKIQNLDIDYASDVAIWDEKGTIYMAITKEKSIKDLVIDYEVESVIYKWLGKHFDILQQIKTSNAAKITPFTIGSSHFLAIANRQNNLGETNIYSEIYKYDLHIDKFVLHQKILTEAASDIQFFSFKNEHEKDNFLVIANMYSKDKYGSIAYGTNSIIYKYVDKYFIPFQSFNLIAAKEWLPIHGPSGEFALAVSSKYDGIKIFQYDGWRFVESENKLTEEAFGKGIQSMSSYILNNKPVIVVANENNNGLTTNLFELNFQNKNMLHTFYDDMLEWCKKELLSYNGTSFEVTNKVARQAENFDPNLIPFSETLPPFELDNDNVTNINEDATKNDRNQIELNEFKIIESHLRRQNSELEEIEAGIRSIMQPSQVNVIQGDLVAENVIFTNDNFFNEIVSESINDINTVNFLLNIVHLQDSLAIDRLQLQSARIDQQIFPNVINGHAAKNMLHKTNPLDIDSLIINGNAIFEGGLKINSTLNGLSFNKKNVLLVEGNQKFIGDLNVSEINAEKVEAKFLNKLAIHFNPSAKKTIKVGQVDTLKAKNIVIGGFINNIDLPTLDKYALRHTGNQELTSEYIFDALNIENNIQIDNNLNHRKIPEQLIRTDEGTYEINQDVQFVEILHAHEIQVQDRLNQINSMEGNLDVLLRNVSTLQSISGNKTFENMELGSRFKLQGKLHGTSFDQMNPVTIVEHEVELFGDFVIQGNVTVEQFLSAKDLVTENEYSLKKLTEMGVKITDREVPVHLNFAQQLNVLEIYVDKINNIEPRSWVVNGGTDRQYIKGWKTFVGDLHITDRTNLQIVNGISVPDLEQNVLYIEGDQVIMGKHYIQNLSTERLTSNVIKLETNDYSNLLLKNTEQALTGSTILQSLKVKTIQCNNLQINGSINDINFKGMIEDTVFLNSTQKVKGQKHFKNITVENLTSRKSMNINKIPQLIRNSEAAFNDGSLVKLPDNLEIENIYFANRLNDLDAADFGSNWLESNVDQTITGDQFFETITIFGNAFIASNHLNELSLDDIQENTVKTDEAHQFESVNFKNVLVSLDNINLSGHIEGLDVDNIFADSGEPILADNLAFNDMVTIRGALFSDGLINNFNLSQLCRFAEEDDLNLIINGSISFMNGPRIANINGKELASIIDTTWFDNKETKLRGNLNFDQIYFEEDITVKGFVDEANLAWLQSNYFSKSMNQTVTAKLDFTEGINFGSDVSAPEAKLRGTVFGISLEDFVTTAILDGVDQVFEELYFVESCEINDLQGEYPVNNMNLQSDVMRYDVKNIVTGRKIVRDVVTDILQVHRNYKVQNVDMLSWIHSAIMKSGNQHIAGRTIFNNTTIFNHGIGLEGLLNGMKFNEDNIMLKSVPQVIEGKKIFFTTPSDPTVFKLMKLKGSLNHVEIADLIKKQAFKNEDTIFQTQVNLNTDLSAPNVNFDGLYQGVNISLLIRNLTNYVSLNNYYNSYSKLYDVSRKIRYSLDHQAHYLNYYKPIQIFEGANHIFPIKLGNVQHLGVIHTVNYTQVIEFLGWDPITGSFLLDTGLGDITYNNDLTYVAPIEYDHFSYLYIEQKLMHIDSANGFTRIGNILENSNASAFTIVAQIPNNGTKKIIPFTLPESDISCILLTYHFDGCMNIFCQDGETLKLQQKIDVENAIDVNTITIDDCIYIIVINMKQTGNCVMIWKYDKNTGLFNLHQNINAVSPNSITTATHNGIHYLAIGSGYMYDTIYSGQIDIRRYDGSGFFTEWQELSLKAPIQIELSVLSSNELILYVLCDNPTEPLITYQFEGISKFTHRMVESTLAKYQAMQIFADEKNQFIITNGDAHFTLIQAVFKGRN